MVPVLRAVWGGQMPLIFLILPGVFHWLLLLLLLLLQMMVATVLVKQASGCVPRGVGGRLQLLAVFLCVTHRRPSSARLAPNVAIRLIHLCVVCIVIVRQVRGLHVWDEVLAVLAYLGHL